MFLIHFYKTVHVDDPMVDDFLDFLLNLCRIVSHFITLKTSFATLAQYVDINFILKSNTDLVG